MAAAIRRGLQAEGIVADLAATGEDAIWMAGSSQFDAVVLDVRACADAEMALPGRFPRIPMYALSAVRPEDGGLLATCRAAGFAGVLVEGVDNAVAGEWIAARTAQVVRRAALADAPRLLRESGLVATHCVPAVPSILPLPLLEGPAEPEALDVDPRQLEPARELLRAGLALVEHDQADVVAALAERGEEEQEVVLGARDPCDLRHMDDAKAHARPRPPPRRPSP